MTKPLTSAEFRDRSNAVWSGRYDYSESLYVNSTTSVRIICSSHGRFSVNARQHIIGKSHCPDCMRLERKIGWQYFVELAHQAHGYKFEYLEWNDGKPKIRCPIHGDYEQIWFNHLSGSGCRQCGFDHIRLKESDAFEKITEIHGGQYELVLGTFSGTQEKIHVICKDHGVQEVIYANLARGQRVLCCAKDSSRSLLEIEIFEFVKSLGVVLEHSYRGSPRGFEIDIYDPKRRIGLEVNGDFWHSDRVIRDSRGCSAKEYHATKRRSAENYGVLLGFIWESDWKNDPEVSKEAIRKLFLERQICELTSKLESEVS